MRARPSPSFYSGLPRRGKHFPQRPGRPPCARLGALHKLLEVAVSDFTHVLFSLFLSLLLFLALSQYSSSWVSSISPNRRTLPRESPLTRLLWSAQARKKFSRYSFVSMLAMLNTDKTHRENGISGLFWASLAVRCALGRLLVLSFPLRTPMAARPRWFMAISSLFWAHW